MTTLVQQAMDTLTVRCNPAHLHPMNEDTIKSYVNVLFNWEIQVSSI